MVHMSTRLYARLVRERVSGIGLQSEEHGTRDCDTSYQRDI